MENHELKRGKTSLIMKLFLILKLWFMLNLGMYKLPHNRINQYYAEMPIIETSDLDLSD